MRAADIEWGMLRGALIGLAIAVVVTIAMVVASQHFLESNDRTFKKSDRARRAAYDEYRNLDDQEQMIATYYPLFQALEKEGVIGDERRLSLLLGRSGDGGGDIRSFGCFRSSMASK